MSEKEQVESGFSYKKILLEIWSWVYSIGIAVIVVLLVKNILFSTTIVKKESMYPTLKENNMLIINRLNQVRGIPLQRGDIVVFEAPDVISADTTIAKYSENSAWDTFRKLFVKTFIPLL